MTSEQFKSVVPMIPTTQRKWNARPDKYVIHQEFLVRLVEWLEEQEVEVSIPEDKDEADGGIDFILPLYDLCFDLKGFGVKRAAISYTWGCKWHENVKWPIYSKTQTDWFVHATRSHPSTWIVGPCSGLTESIYGYAPYYLIDDCKTVGELISDLKNK